MRSGRCGCCGCGKGKCVCIFPGIFWSGVAGYYSGGVIKSNRRVYFCGILLEFASYYRFDVLRHTVLHQDPMICLGLGYLSWSNPVLIIRWKFSRI